MPVSPSLSVFFSWAISSSSQRHDAPEEGVLLAHRERRFREWEDHEIDRDMDRSSWCWATERKRRPAKPVQPDAHSA